MCGINGFIQPGSTHEQKLNDIRNMNSALIHRGPDSNGVWNYNESLYFGHQRLSIIELSELGHQPMISQSRRSSIVLNGEIYNFKELAKELGKNLRGNSDTEVLLEYIEKFGIDKALHDIRGMYAFAYFSQDDQKLILARDPFGEKPLYYGRFNNGLYFSSELKSFRKINSFQANLDIESIYLYLNYNYIPSPKTIYNGIQKLQPGHYLRVDLNNSDEKLRCYFKPENAPDNSMDEYTVLEKASSLLNQSIKRQMISDVPLGVFLSSGVDSSLIAARMRDFSSQPVKSFSIGFENADYDESTISRKIAKLLELDHTEYICSSKDLLDQVNRVAEIYDEPFSDSSQIPTLILSSITKKSVTVALSGDGGDEIFGGYNRYIWLKKLHKGLSLTPEVLFSFAKLLPIPYVANKLDKLKQVAPAKNLSEAYQFSLQNNHSHDIYTNVKPIVPATINGPADMMLEDQKRYLPDDILTKVDRASMSHSLETRAPYLDRDLYEFMSKVPIHFKINKGVGKWPLRKMLSEYLGDKIINSPKKGFAVPIDSWFRNELKTWVHDTLSASNIEKYGILNAKAVSQYLDNHMSSEANRQFELWNILVLQSWLDNWK